MKTCIKCFQKKAQSEFNKHRKYPDGLNATCKLCHRAASRQWGIDNPEKAKARLRATYLSNKKLFVARASKWYLENRDRALVLRRARFKLDPSAAVADCARRNAIKVQAIPAWADHKKIRAIYKKASRMRKEVGTEFHVDHIVPLRSRIVCGLHCEANLQILPKRENVLKSNRHWPNMP